MSIGARASKPPSWFKASKTFKSCGVSGGRAARHQRKSRTRVARRPEEVLERWEHAHHRHSWPAYLRAIIHILSPRYPSYWIYRVVGFDGVGNLIPLFSLDCPHLTQQIIVGSIRPRPLRLDGETRKYSSFYFANAKIGPLPVSIVERAVMLGLPALLYEIAAPATGALVRICTGHALRTRGWVAGWSWSEFCRQDRGPPRWPSVALCPSRLTYPDTGRRSTAHSSTTRHRQHRQELLAFTHTDPSLATYVRW